MNRRRTEQTFRLETERDLQSSGVTTYYRRSLEARRTAFTLVDSRSSADQRVDPDPDARAERAYPEHRTEVVATVFPRFRHIAQIKPRRHCSTGTYQCAVQDRIGATHFDPHDVRRRELACVFADH